MKFISVDGDRLIARSVTPERLAAIAREMVADRINEDRSHDRRMRIWRGKKRRVSGINTEGRNEHF